MRRPGPVPDKAPADSSGTCGRAEPAPPGDARGEPPGNGATPQRRGSILVAVIWIIFFLVLLAAAITARVYSLLDVARRIEVRTVGLGLARAGVEQAIATAVGGSSNTCHRLGESWNRDETLFRDIALPTGSFSVYHERPESGTNRLYGLEDESARLNLNTLPIDGTGHRMLVSLLQSAGGVDARRASDLAAALLDWRDASNEVFEASDGGRGAEADYYRGLSPGYPCHDGPYGSIEEVLLVRGMDSALLERLRPYITVYGDSATVNINTADRVVLLALAAAPRAADPQTGSALVEEILRLRAQSVPFTRRTDITSDLLPGLEAGESTLLQQIGSFVGCQATCFRGTAAGRPDGATEAEERTVRFVIDRYGQILYWEED